MPSPFPGMDPYIEAYDEWEDFHTSLLAAIKAKLNATLPSRYHAKVDVFLFVSNNLPRKDRRRFEPDVQVIEKHLGTRHSASGVALMTRPETIILHPRPVKKRKSILVVDRRTNRVVTAIEVLSPSNKGGGENRKNYLFKREEYLANQVNLVELDLLRGGKKLPLGNAKVDVEDYYVLVCRAWESPRAGWWPFTIRDRLPNVPIPLAEDIPDTILPLRECVDRAFDESAYATELNYGAPLEPPVSKKDQAWARSILHAK